jgi:two-component system, OmpR family, response regulator
MVLLAPLSKLVREPIDTSRGSLGESTMIRRNPSPDALRILVVEDNADAAASTALLLELDGHEVHIAGDGAAGLAAAEALNPDAVLLDIALPGIDGYEVARRLKARPGTNSPLLIAVTGYGRDVDRAQSAAAGIDLHLVKPVEPELLQKLLRGGCRRLTPQQELAAGGPGVCYTSWV